MKWRKSDDELLEEGRREWAFEKARLAPHHLPDGRAFDLSIEESSGVGLAGVFANAPGVFFDALTFGRSAGQLDASAGTFVLVVRVEGEAAHLRQHREREDAVSDALGLFTSLEAQGLSALDQR